MTLSKQKKSLLKKRLFYLKTIKRQFDMATTLLDYRTQHNIPEKFTKDSFLDDKPTFGGSKLSIRIFPDFIRIILSEINEDNYEREKYQLKKEHKKRERTQSQKTEDSERSKRRAYRTVIDKVMQIKGDRMITLTFKENITDKKIAYKAFTAFIRLMRIRFKTFDYIAVPEYQKRGAVHFHVVTNTFYMWTSVLSLWRKAVKTISNETGGIHINKKAASKYTEKGYNGLGRYIAKYILKDIKTDVKNEKSYYSSKIKVGMVKIFCYSLLKIRDFDIFDAINSIIGTLTGKYSTKSTQNRFDFKMWDNSQGIMYESRLLNAYDYKRLIDKERFEIKNVLKPLARSAA